LYVSYCSLYTLIVRLRYLNNGNFYESKIIYIAKKGGVTLKLRHNSKYIFLMTFIGCVALLYNNLSNRDDNKLEGKPSRIIIKSSDIEVVQDAVETTEDGGVPVIITNDSSEVQTLPIPNADAPIIVNPLQ
jgi:hypothetical protein